MQFPKLEDTSPMPPFTLVFNYKRSTYHREKGHQSQLKENQERNKKEDGR